RDHHVAGDAHRAARGALEDLERLVEDVVGALEGERVVAGGEVGAGAQLVLGGFGEPDHVQLLVSGGDGHRYTSSLSRMPSPCSGMVNLRPGGMTAVVYVACPL